MRSPIQLQYFIVHMLDTQAKPSHTDGFYRFELSLLQRARLAFKRNLTSFLPLPMLADAIDQALQLIAGQKRGRTAAKIYKLEFSTAQGSSLRVEGGLLGQCVQIHIHIARVLVRIDAEVAELASLAAEGNVQIQSERCSRLNTDGGRRVEPLEGGRHVRLCPDRKGGISGYEIAAHLGGCGILEYVQVHVRCR